MNFETPRISYAGNGINTDFSFIWTSSVVGENYVTLDDVLLTEGVEYEMEGYTPEQGGTAVFYTPPTGTVVIYRQTPITQQVDYVEGDAFPAETHEFQMDKDTRILQEIRVGAGQTGTSVDLQSIPNEDSVRIANSAGTDALIEPWTADGQLAGVSMGEVIEAGGAAPADGNPTTKPDGYIWYVLEELP